MQQTDVKNASEFLDNLNAGIFQKKVTSALKTVAMNAVALGKPGKLVITIDLSQINDSKQVNVKHKLAYSHPTPTGKSAHETQGTTTMYVANNGDMSIHNDSQGKLPLGSVSPIK